MKNGSCILEIVLLKKLNESFKLEKKLCLRFLEWQ